MLGLQVQWNNNFFLLSWSSHSDGETDIKHALKVTTDVARVCGDDGDSGGDGGGGSGCGGDGGGGRGGGSDGGSCGGGSDGGDDGGDGGGGDGIEVMVMVVCVYRKQLLLQTG